MDCPEVGILNIAYQATKGAVVNMTRSWAIEWAPLKIRVNAIAPGLVRTPFIAGITEQPDLLAKIEQLTPLGRLAETDDITGPVLFLAKSGFSNGYGPHSCGRWRDACPIALWRTKSRHNNQGVCGSSRAALALTTCERKICTKDFDLSGKVAALTGSTAGMGFAIARGLAQCGAKIVVSSNAQEDTDQAAHALSSEGFDVAGVRCDITDRRDIGQFGAEAKQAFGKVDILFCNAVGLVPVGPVQDVDLDALDKLLTSTVSSNLALVRQFLPEMAERRYGSIVMMSSIAAQRPSSTLGGYGAAKAALNSIVRSIAIECGAKNVRANAIAPSFVRTAFSKEFWGDVEREKALIAKDSGGPHRRGR